MQLVIAILVAFLAKGMMKIASILILFALVGACVYFIFGAKKNAAVYYKAFIIVFAVSELVRVINRIIILGTIPRDVLNEIPNGIRGLITPVVVDVILIFVLCVLAFIANLGKAKTMILGLAALAISMIEMIQSLVPALMAGENILVAFVSTGSRVVLCLALLLMVIGKYKDKAARNTK